jgi:hypothetical protein
MYNCSIKGLTFSHSEERIFRLLTGVEAIFANDEKTDLRLGKIDARRL